LNPEAAQFLDKARRLLDEAAGRPAYLAGFHAAQAFIFEQTGRAVKTHHGVQSEFLRLTRNDARFDTDLRGLCCNPPGRQREEMPSRLGVAVRLLRARSDR
jgi:uncharacterized protein (UPF0332 family)